MIKRMPQIRKLIASVTAMVGMVLSPLASAKSEAPATPHPALWKVADEDTTIYLFGTVHVLPGDVPWFHGAVANAFNNSQELVTEVVEPDPTQMERAVLEKAALPQGTTLRGMLSDEERAVFESALTNLGMPVDTFDPLEPWFAAVTLSLIPLKKAGFSADTGVETVLANQAKQHGQRQSALETAEGQLDMFDGLPLETQKRYLMAVAKAVPTMSEEFSPMIKAWETGNADKLASLMNANEEDPTIVATLLTNRNKAWAQWIKSRLDAPGTVFMAVGAGHLAGRGSVQEQLTAQGITVTRLQ